MTSFAPKFTITHAITGGLTAIERARGFLEAASLSEEWLRRMSQRALLLEAHHTTHIEGTELTIEQAERIWSGQEVAQVKEDDARELLNYREAFNLVSDYLGSGEPVTEGLIREIHKRLVEGVRGGEGGPGTYRAVQNYVINSRTREVIYTPPPPEAVAPAMQQLVSWLRKEETIHPVLVAGIAQFQLVHIHPFLDGNGRTSRLLSTLCLYRAGYDFKRLFTLSEYYDRNRSAFYRALQSVREQDMDLTGWLAYFVEGLATQLAEIKARGEVALRSEVVALDKGLAPRQAAVLGFVMSRRRLTVGDLESLFPDVSRRSLQRDVKELLSRGLLKEVASGPTDPGRHYVLGEL
ncbi:MAG: Fic family protein [Acidobacteria bacterium]|nr:Fic family protein [Acidobacteriota bacterium]